MRKWLVWMVALCMALALPVRAEEADFYGALLERMDALSLLRTEEEGICSGAREEHGSFTLSYMDALQTQGTYDLQSFRAQLAERGRQMEAVAGKLKEQIDALAAVTVADAVQRGALEACREYAGDALSVANDFLAVNAFHQAQYDASAPLDELTTQGALENQFTTARAWEKASAEVSESFSALSAPAFLDQIWRQYCHQVQLFATMCMLQREGIGYGDTLRLYSASQLLTREYSAMAKYELSMYDLIYREYAQMEARLQFLSGTMEPEIVGACKNPMMTGFSWQQVTPEVILDYEMADSVYPNLYHSMDSVVNLIAHTRHGTRDLLVTAQVGDFTQQYRQKVTVGADLTRLAIKPAVLANLPDMTAARDTQLSFTVTDARSGELLVQESHPMKVYSLYDFGLYDNEFGLANYDDILAWTTPESDGVLKVRRQAITWMDEHNLFIDSLIGYQNPSGLPDDQVYLISRAQAIALQGAISDLGVRYNMGAFSLNSFQRILMPDAVVENRSGVCVETAVLLASALQSAKMHAMILFIPGHAQVALETWRGSAQYFLLETTMLPFADSEDSFNAFCRYLTQDEWNAYLQDCASRGVAYVVDCNLMEIFDYQGLFKGMS